MQKRIEVAYQKSSYKQYFRNMTFEYKDGDITLTGTVRTFHVKQIAQEIALHIDGIKHVNNSLQVVDSV